MTLFNFFKLRSHSFLVLWGLFSLAFLNARAQAPSHDPSTMIRNNDGRYWIFTTGDGIWAMSSSNPDFTDWRVENTVFPIGTYPSWIDNYVQDFGGFFWAPEVFKRNGQYYLYYSCAGTGAPAAIGFATASDLSGPWTDRGLIVAGNNAIDPAILQDDDGSVWMTWGNWQSGIDILRLDPNTGYRADGNTYHLVSGEVEGPSILKRDGYYYLFYQRGLCCNGVNSSYYNVVARSTSVTGPYTDERVFLPNKNGNIIGPGHVGYSYGRLTYHYYDGNDNGAAKLMVTTMGYSNGWPVAGATDNLGHFNGTYSFTAAHSGKAMDVYNFGTANGTNIAQWSYWGGDAQKFIVTNEYNDWHRITPYIAQDKSLDVNEISTTAGANIQIWEYWAGDGQLFKIQNAGSGRWRLINKNSGQCLDVLDAAQEDGANIIQWPCLAGNTNQMFGMVMHSSNTRSQVVQEVDDELSEDSMGQEGILIWPNPARGQFHLSLGNTVDMGAPVSMKLVATDGKVVYQDQFAYQENMTINPNAKPGVYTLILQTKAASFHRKLVIQ
ncbi:family 43 glycosylhydrolase [Persicobacter diffluens]|uniref:Ricin B lectin domain-containing protein n=1 Tax=Persicobacter diffluens TaxID=981 RepID=A0AAN4W3Z6_9BACT|nr:hypothetical protein PEDI_47700 [Persicobacter diffluens]